MLFVDPVFLFVYLPLVLAGYYLACRARRPRAAVWWSLLASIAFYIYDDAARLLPLIAGSIAFNYAVGTLLRSHPSRLVLATGVGGNLLLLGYFKYAGFVAENVAALAGLGEPTLAIALPIGISFFTFTQIAFLVDVYRRRAARYRVADYALFVTFFPHLVAGPILRHHETVPQLARMGLAPTASATVARGWAWFAFGVAKKVLLADGIAPYADAVFDGVEQGARLGTLDAWIGTVAYGLQLYFDFSGYSDMAIGLALIFGVAFPLNFDSPYKAASLIDFWRRWHMTLSAFLRDYLYVPLGGNRRGGLRRYANVMITMVLGGLWHGASWNFAIWGAMHGVGLVFNHAARLVLPHGDGATGRYAGRLATLLFVVVAWVPFRAESLDTALRVWAAMFVWRGDVTILAGAAAAAWIVILGTIALVAPNTQQMLGVPSADAPPADADDAVRTEVGALQARSQLEWRLTPGWALALGVLCGAAIARAMLQPTSFLYFRF